MASANCGLSDPPKLGNGLLNESKFLINNSLASGDAAEKIKRTVRLSLELSPTSETSNYPEINYARLIRLEEKKQKKIKKKLNGASEPIEDNDDDVARIAAEFEKKYGTSYGRGRGRSKRDDHCDIGMGYDESDSFIDNTEAYDEVIPDEVETIEGGFYINCGALEFKQLNIEAHKLKTDEIIKMPKKSRLRIASSSSSSDDAPSENGDGKSTTKRYKNIQEKFSENPPDEEAKIAQRIESANNSDVASKNEKAMPLEKKIYQHKHKNKEKQIEQTTNPQISGALDETGSDTSEKEKTAMRQKTVKTTTVKDMLKAKRDSFLKMQVSDTSKSNNGELRGATSKSSEEETGSSSAGEDSDTNSDSNTSASLTKRKSVKEKAYGDLENNEDNSEKLRSSDTILPELENETKINIMQFKELAKSKNLIGKRFQFDQELTELFLRLDESLLCMEKSRRNKVFAHLEYQLVLPRYFFLRKAKHLRIKEEKLKMQRSLAKLKRAVIEAMPKVISNYEIEVRKYAEMQSTSNENGTTVKMPKKKFPWNTNLRNLLYDVYQTRWISFPNLCSRKETLEDFISTYLKEKVVEIWPTGWMCYEEIAKEIEKKKHSSKKTKEKKQISVNNNFDPIMTIAASTTTPNATNVAQATNAVPKQSLNSYAKQFEDFTLSSRSQGNSDSDSVASSNPSNGHNLKRKGTSDDVSKNKSVKLNTNEKAAKPILAERFSEPSAVLSANVFPSDPLKVVTKAAITPPKNSAPIGEKITKHSSTSGPQQQTIIIDLDHYRSASGVLEKQKQSQKTSLGMERTGARSSSSESDGVEIVGVFEAKQNVTSISRAKKNQNATPSPINMQLNNNNNKLGDVSASFEAYKTGNTILDVETTFKDPLQ